MAKYLMHHPNPSYYIPVQIAGPDLDLADYTLETMWVLNRDGKPAPCKLYIYYEHYESIINQPAVRLVRFVADQLTWSQDEGLKLILDDNGLWLDSREDWMFREDIAFEQQDKEVASDMSRELFFAGCRIIGYSITRID